MDVSQALKPKLTKEQIQNQCSWFPGDIPEEVISLYSWRGGTEEDSEPPFWIRDTTFCTPARAKLEYEMMMKTYGSFEEDHKMLKYCFPISSIKGAIYALPTKGHNFQSVLKKPIISVFEGIDIYYFSIQSMIETCTEWVNHEKYAEDGQYPEEEELKIWNQYNPNVFES